MTGRASARLWTPERFRARYFPGSRIGQGLISAAPWINVLLLLVLFAVLERRVVLQPGVIVDLPPVPFVEGAGPGLVAVVMSVGGSDSSPGREIVFFDDERFLVDNEQQMTNFRQALEARLRQQAEAGLIIQADRRVPHGTIIEIVNLARQAGVRRIDVAGRPR